MPSQMELSHLFKNGLKLKWNKLSLPCLKNSNLYLTVLCSKKEGNWQIERENKLIVPRNQQTHKIVSFSKLCLKTIDKNILQSSLMPQELLQQTWRFALSAPVSFISVTS